MPATTRRGRLIVVLAIVVMTSLAWAYLFRLAAGMASMELASAAMAMAAPARAIWALPELAAMFAMWSVMMVAMMLPSATPMILLYDKVSRRRQLQGRGGDSTALFVGGYLLIWTAFSAGATLLNGGLHSGGFLTAGSGKLTPVLAGLALIAAGAYQWTSLKSTCLNHCRSPVGFLMAHWREGRWAATRMGIHHGIYCVGCCWLMMLLLFVLGVMNLLWIAVLTVIVLIEKAAPRGRVVGQLTGLLFFGWGAWLVGSAGW